MAMGKRTVNSLGVLGVALVLGGAYFGVAAPILSGKNAIELELQQAQQLGSSYEAKLLSFENGDSDATRAATDTMEVSFPIPSTSRALPGQSLLRSPRE
jgi:type II secretory pathway component PulM